MNKLKYIFNHSFFSVPSPINLSFFWNLGSMLFFIFIIQMLSGIILSMIYSNESMFSFFSVEYIMRNISNGNLIRLIHLNMASMFFLFIYLHLFRGLWYSSFKYKDTWNSGVTILFILMLTAFLGYVLPWGQMSFWAATVISKFLSAIPIFGDIILMWVWSNFSVGNSTLKFFFSLHYLLPMILFLLILFHFISLHFKGSSSKISFSFHHMKMKFYPFFMFKDFLNFLMIFFMFLIFNLWMTSEGENFIIANPSSTPNHIKPEWYFLFAYAILRSIPNKLAGVILMVFSILVFYFLCFTNSKYNFKNFMFTITFITVFLMLSWLGYNEAVDLYVTLGMIFTFLYFFIFMVFLIKMIFTNYLF